MRGFKLSTLIVLCLCITLAHADLSNPDFETGSLSPWYNSRNNGELWEEWDVTIAEAHSGTYSATSRGNGELRQDFLAPIPVDQIVELSFWVKQPLSGATAFVPFYSDGTMPQSTFILNSKEWKFFDVTSDLSFGKELVGISVWGYASFPQDVDRTYVDDFTLTVVPVPGAFVLGSLGLTFSGWLLKKHKMLLKKGPK